MSMVYREKACQTLPGALLRSFHDYYFYSLCYFFNFYYEKYQIYLKLKYDSNEHPLAGIDNHWYFALFIYLCICWCMYLAIAVYAVWTYFTKPFQLQIPLPFTSKYFSIYVLTIRVSYISVNIITKPMRVTKNSPFPKTHSIFIFCSCLL